MKFDRLSLLLLLALGATRILPSDPTLVNALVLPFLVRVTFCIHSSSLVSRRSTVLAEDSTGIGQFPKAA